MSGAMRNDILGVPFTTDDGRKVVRAKAHAALSAYVPYLVVPTLQSQTLDGVTTVTGDAVTAALDAVASVDRQWGVPQRGYESGDRSIPACAGEPLCVSPQNGYPLHARTGDLP